MRDQPRYDALEPSPFFANGMSSRPLVEGTIPHRGERQPNEAFETGKRGGELVDELPVELTPELLARGRERYELYCSMCHAPTGRGDGMIVRRGLKRPPSYHSERLREVPIGHFFDVITNGFGAMPSYRVQIVPRDRWAIAAYVRALQLSENATLEDVPEAERTKLEEARDGR
jgi:cytochrome c5